MCLYPLVYSMQWAWAVLSSVDCLALQYSSTLSHKRHDFKKLSMSLKCVFWFSPQNLSHMFLILRITEPDMTINVNCPFIYRISQEEWTKLRQSVPYVKIYRYNPKHLYPKLNVYGDNDHRKVWASVGSTFYTPSVTPYSSTAHARQRDILMQWPWRLLYSTVTLTSQDNGQLRPA